MYSMYVRHTKVPHTPHLLKVLAASGNDLGQKSLGEGFQKCKTLLDHQNMIITRWPHIEISDMNTHIVEEGWTDGCDSLCSIVDTGKKCIRENKTSYMLEHGRVRSVCACLH